MRFWDGNPAEESGFGPDLPHQSNGFETRSRASVAYLFKGRVSAGLAGPSTGERVAGVVE
jgi:hypothetical protein